MALFRVSGDSFERVAETTFANERLQERQDLQRLLRADISVLGDDLMVIGEEFGDWEDSNRRIDLLCLDSQARLVVVELKRTGEFAIPYMIDALRTAGKDDPVYIGIIETIPVLEGPTMAGWVATSTG